jgi:hypothetical protein
MEYFTEKDEENLEDWAQLRDALTEEEKHK